MKADELIDQWSKLWLPPERPPLSKWAEQNIWLSPEYSSRSGELRLFGWQREIFDAFTDPRVEEIDLMCGTQLVKTLFIQAALAYVVAADPGPALVVQPAADDAKSFSSERLAPMIRDCDCLHGRISENKRDSSNTILAKHFPGGSLSLVGAIAPGKLARRSIRYLFCDEVDKYPASAGKEGDPISLARERTITYQSRRKIILTCSPTTQHSRIAKAYSESDQRKPWAPCPYCGQGQILKWAQVRWDKSLPEDERPASAWYECEHCASRWSDNDRWAAANLATFRAEKPFRGRAGFWISHLYSPWKTLAAMVEDFLSRKDDRQRLQVFINTTLAEIWQEEGETPDYELLYARREGYPYGENAIVPRRGLFLTAAVDVQDSPPRLEVEVEAWGRDKESWSVDYRVLQVHAENGQPLPVTSPELWDLLNAEVLQRDYRHESGGTMPIMLMAIDTGSRPKPVYAFALKHPQPAYGPAGLKLFAPRSVMPVKGNDDALRIISAVSKEDAARKRQGVRIVSIGTACCKQELYDLLRHVRPRADGAPVPGCKHFPMYEKAYFEGLCSEKRIVKENGDVTWEKNTGSARNEPLDLKVYNRGAATVFGIDRMFGPQWEALERQLGVASPPPQTAAVVAPPPPPEQQPQAPQIARGFAAQRQGGGLFGSRPGGWFSR